MHTFTIPGELTDLNTYIKALNSSRWGGNAIKQCETTRVAVEARAAKFAEITAFPVRVRFDWYSKDNRMDVDNVAFAKKFILDGMVDGGILPNDSRKYVRGFADEFYIDKHNPRVVVTIVSV